MNFFLKQIDKINQIEDCSEKIKLANQLLENYSFPDYKKNYLKIIDHIIKKNIKESINFLERLIEKYPNELCLFYKIENLKNKNPKKTINLIKRLIEKYPDKLYLYDQLISLRLLINEKNYESYLKKGLQIAINLGASNKIIEYKTNLFYFYADKPKCFKKAAKILTELIIKEEGRELLYKSFFVETQYNCFYKEMLNIEISNPDISEEELRKKILNLSIN